MVRAAMGLEEVVQIAPKQISLKELSSKRAQVEKRQEDMAKRIIDTQKKKKLESFTKKLQDLSMEKCKITAELAQRKSFSSGLVIGVQAWRLRSLLPKTSQRTRRISGSKDKQKLRLTSRISSHTRTVQQFWPTRPLHVRFVRKPSSKQRKRKHFLLGHYVNANSTSQKLWSSFIRDCTEYDLHALVETHLPSARHDQHSDQLRAVGWKLTEFSAARPSPRSATGTTGGAAISARSHLRIDSSMDVLSCAQTVEDHEPIDFAAAIVHGCHARILLVTCYLTDSQGTSELNLTKLARLGAIVGD